MSNSDRLRLAAEKLRVTERSYLRAALADTMDDIANIPEQWFLDALPSVATLCDLILGPEDD